MVLMLELRHSLETPIADMEGVQEKVAGVKETFIITRTVFNKCFVR